MNIDYIDIICLIVVICCFFFATERYMKHRERMALIQKDKITTINNPKVKHKKEKKNSNENEAWN